tara:strand:- start:234 stop:1295 length:1062 start_codon:yes stop_codon:yes gene_type:complete
MSLSVSNFNIDNASGQTVRLDIQACLKALQGQSAETSDLASSQCVAGMWFLRSDTNTLKIRGSGSTFTTVGNIDEDNLGLLSKSGGTMTGPLLIDDSSSASTPALSFDTNTNLGLFRNSANIMGFSSGGAEQMIFDANGITLRSQNEVRFGDSDSSNYVGMKAPSTVASNKTITLPDETGTLLTSGSSIANSNLANSSVTVGSTAINLGASATTIAGLTSLTSTTVVAGTVKSSNTEAPVFQNTSGTEKGRLIEAYTTFNGTGTAALENSYNVSSLTDHGTGDFEFSFSNNLDSTEYCTHGSSDFNTSHPFIGGSVRTRNVSSCRMVYGTSGGSNAAGFPLDPSIGTFIAIGG